MVQLKFACIFYAYASYIFWFFLIPVLLYSDLSAKYSSVHSFLKSSSWYHFVRQDLSSKFWPRQFTTIATLLRLQHSLKAATCSEHFNFPFSLIFMGIVTSFSTLRRDRSSGSPALRKKMNFSHSLIIHVIPYPLHAALSSRTEWV